MSGSPRSEKLERRTSKKSLGLFKASPKAEKSPRNSPVQVPNSPVLPASPKGLSPAASPRNSPSPQRKSKKIPSARSKSENDGQTQILEQCVAQLFKAVVNSAQDSKVLQRYLFVLAMDDPKVVRQQKSIVIQDLLGQYLAEAKLCIQGLTMMISALPTVLTEKLKQDSAWVVYLFGSLADRIALYDHLLQPTSPGASVSDSDVSGFWCLITPSDRYEAILRFYCKIVRMYTEIAPQVFEKCSKQIFEFLLRTLRITNEIMSEEIVTTIQLIINKTDSLGFFIKFFVVSTQNIMMQEVSEREQYLNPDDVLRCTNQFYVNVGNILSSVVAYASPTDEKRLSTISNSLLVMQFFPILIAASFRASSCKGYMPFIYQLFNNQKALLKPCHFSSIEDCIYRISKILNYVNQNKVTFGTMRYFVLRLIVSLINFDQASINNQIVTQNILKSLLELMIVTYPNATLFHHLILDCFHAMMLKDRRTKNQSIYLVLLEDPEKFLAFFSLLVSNLDQKEFGICHTVSYVEPARQIFQLFYDTSRVKETLKTQPLLTQQCKNINKASKEHITKMEKARQTTKKTLMASKKAKDQVISASEPDDESAVLAQLKQMDDKDEIAYSSSVSNLRRLFKKSQ